MMEEEEIRASEEKWDELLAKPEAKRVMREMAREAREEYHAGQTTDVATTDDVLARLSNLGSES
jgi:hypothetical protein